MRKIAFLFLIAFAISISPDLENYSYAQDAKVEPAKQDEGVLDGVTIFERYKDCAVDIKTTLTFQTPNALNLESENFGGSGFFIDKEGSVATVGHVVKEKNDEFDPFNGMLGPKYVLKIVNYEYFVELPNKNRKYRAELVGANVYSDTALLRVLDIDPADYAVAKMGDPDKLKVGEKVYAIGSPHGLSNSLTEGIVSATNRYVDYWYLEDLIQTTAPINPGNSGGPLINSRGEVVGLNDLKIPYSDGMGFAISVKLLKLDQLKKGSPVMPWFGAEAMAVNFRRMGSSDKPTFEDLAEIYNRTGINDPDSLNLLAKLTDPNNKGSIGWAMVTSVDNLIVANKNSPARIAGLKKGDVITRVNGKAVKSGMDVRFAILEIPVGKEFDLELVRVEKGGMATKLTVKMKLQDKPEGVK